MGPKIAYDLARYASKMNIHIASVESCTGGLIADMITDVPGCSDFFLGGVISYSNEMKQKVLKVKKETLKSFGAVSEEVVCEMAMGIMDSTGAEFTVSTTGIAGPTGGSEKKPVGLVYIGIADSSGCISHRFVFEGERRDIKTKAAETAIRLLLERILECGNEY